MTNIMHRPIVAKSYVEEKIAESIVQEDITAPVRGALWLDEHYPGWAHLIDLPTFNIRLSRDCVCGQVFFEHTDEYPSGYDWFESEYGVDESAKYGFCVSEAVSSMAAVDDEYDYLQKEWERLIEERQKT